MKVSAFCSASPPDKKSYPPYLDTCTNAYFRVWKSRWNASLACRKSHFLQVAMKLQPYRSNVPKSRKLRTRENASYWVEDGKRRTHGTPSQKSVDYKEDENQIRSLTRSMLLWLGVHTEMGKMLRRDQQ